MTDTRPFMVLSDLKGSLGVPADDTGEDGRYQGYVEQANAWCELEVTSVGDDAQLVRDGYFWKKAKYACISYARALAYEHENWTEKARVNEARAYKEVETLLKRVAADRPSRSRLVVASRGLAEGQVLPTSGISGYVTRAL